jgi:hypothetical protein
LGGESELMGNVKRNRVGRGQFFLGMLQALAWVAVTVAGLLTVSPALAQENAANKAAAEALYQRGQQLMSGGKYEEACDKFRSSQELDAGLGTLLHLADCYEKLGRTASAWATFEEASSLAASRGETARYEIARARAARLKPALSYIVIRSEEPLPDATIVERDGSPLPQALWGVPVPNDPGEMTVTVVAEGYVKVELKTVVPADAPEPVEVTLPALKPVASLEPSPKQPTVDAPSTAADAPPAQREPDLRTWGVVAGGVGVVALGVSLVLTIMGNADYQDSLDECSSGNENRCGPGGTKLRNAALSKLGVATGFGIGGAVALGGGALLYFSAPNDANATPLAAGLGYRGVW